MVDALFQLRSVIVRGRAQPRLDVDVTILRGITAVIGPSGAGKTTLLDLLVGYRKPASGAVTFHRSENGAIARFWSPAEGGLWPHLTVREHLTTVAPRHDGAPARDWLAVFDLTAVADVRPGRLSLGQQARVGVARALASESRVLVLDEPFAHVDPARATAFFAATIDHLRAIGASLVFATHAPSMVLCGADAALCLDAGRVVFHGGVEELYLRPESAALAGYLGHTNWIPEAEQDTWFAGPAPRCVRPEHLTVAPVAGALLVVQRSLRHGAVSATTVRHEPSGLVRIFHHATIAVPLTEGLRVILRVCLLVALLVALTVGSGCDGGASNLGMRAVSHRHLPPLGARLPAPRGLARTPDDGLIVLDNAGRVLVYGANGAVRRTWMMPAYAVGRPEGVCLLRDGRIAVADTHYSRVVIFDGKGTVLATIGSRGTGPGQFLYPIKVIQDPSGSLYVAEYGSNDRVQKFTEQGQLILSFGSFGGGPEQFQRPSGLTWLDHRVYVADAVNHRIQVFTEDGHFLNSVGGPGNPLGLKMPYDLCAGPTGDLFTCEYGGGRVTRFTTDGRVVGRFGRTGRGAGQMMTPWGLAVTSNGHVLVADTGNRRLVEWRR